MLIFLTWVGEQIPFIFVPHGAPEPPEWMAQHPDWVKIPATMVPRGRTRGRAERDDADWEGRRPGEGEATDFGQWSAEQFVLSGRLLTGAVPDGDGKFLETMPEDRCRAAVAAFLDANRVFVRLGGRAASDPILRVADAIPRGAQEVKTSAPKVSVAEPVLDRRGQPIISGSGRALVRPAGLPPEFFIREAGLFNAD